METCFNGIGIMPKYNLCDKGDMAIMVIHYELILFYALGFTPRDAIRDFGYSRTSAYRFYKIYRLAGKKLANRFRGLHSMPSNGTRTKKNKEKHVEM